jgi:DNA-binding response OmpR family regulator
MRVLVVEDDRPLAEVIVEGLRAAGMAVDVAHDGPDDEHRTLQRHRLTVRPHHRWPPPPPAT